MKRKNRSKMFKNEKIRAYDKFRCITKVHEAYENGTKTPENIRQLPIVAGTFSKNKKIPKIHENTRTPLKNR